MIYFFWCSIIALIIVTIYVKFIVPLGYFKRIGVPGPPPIPFFGSLLADTKDGKGNHEIHQVHLQKYGRVYGYLVGSMPCYIVADLDIVKEILIKEFPSFSNRSMMFKTPGLDQSLANLRDAKWKRIRNILNPTYTTAKMRHMFPLVNDSIDTLITKMQPIVDNHQPIDICSWFKQLSLDVIISCAFGARSNIQNNQHDRLASSATAIFKMKPSVIALSFMFPKLAPLFIHFDRSFMDGIKYINQAVTNIIKLRRQQGATGADYKDLLQLMIDAGATDNSGLTDSEIVAQSSTVMLAGYETTSSCAIFTAYLLAFNSDVQDKLIQEIKRVCQKKDITYDMLAQMPYLNMVIHESLRMYPPGYILLREATTTFQSKGYTFPKGIPVFIPVYGLHHDADVWPDPYTFNPERFTKDAVEARHPCSYLPFGLGLRNCIGMRFAMLQVKLLLARILSRYKFAICPETETPIKVIAATTLTPKNALYLRILSQTS